MKSSTASLRVSPLERAGKIAFLVNGIFLVFIGIGGAATDLLAYYTGNGPLGAHLFNAPYAVGFFVEHGFAAFFGILTLTIILRDPKPMWHIVLAALHLFAAVSIVIFWQGAVEWGVAVPEATIAVVHTLIAIVHITLYLLAGKANQTLRA